MGIFTPSIRKIVSFEFVLDDEEFMTVGIVPVTLALFLNCKASAILSASLLVRTVSFELLWSSFSASCIGSEQLTYKTRAGIINTDNNLFNFGVFIHVRCYYAVKLRRQYAEGYQQFIAGNNGLTDGGIAFMDC